MNSPLAALGDFGWQVEFPESGPEPFPPEVRLRYPELPEELVSFMQGFAVCLNPLENAWLTSARDLSEPHAFSFDEFERLSLQAAEGDSEWLESIRAFWSRHFPFAMSVGGSYQYFALVLDGEHRGAVVHGIEPEFESPDVIAAGLPDFLAQLLAAAASDAPAYPFSGFLPPRRNP